MLDSLNWHAALHLLITFATPENYKMPFQTKLVCVFSGAMNFMEKTGEVSGYLLTVISQKVEVILV